MVPLPLSPQILGRRLLRTIVTGITTKSSRSPFQVPTAWDAIDLAIHVRITITRIIQTSIVVDNGMDAGPIENFRPEARQERRSSSREDFDPMVQQYRGYHQECPMHLLHIVAMIRMIVRGDDATMIDAIVTEAVVVVEAERVVDMSTSHETQVRPVSLVASLT